MTTAIKVTSPSGAQEILPLTDSVLSLNATAGASYRIVDTENPALTFEAIMRRVGDDLLIDLLGTSSDVRLVDYFFVCEFDFRGCAIELDSLGGPKGETLTPDNQDPVQLSDGTIMLWSTPPAVVGLTPPTTSSPQTVEPQANNENAADDEAFSMPAWAVGSGVALLGVAALGGGGGGGDDAVGSDNADRGGSGTLAGSSITLTRIESDQPAPVDEDGQPLADPGLNLGAGPIAESGQTNDASPTLIGTIGAELEDGQVIIVFRDGQDVGRATVDGLQWSFTDTGGAAGERTYAVQISDGQGNESPRSDSYTIFVDGTPPDAPAFEAVTGDNFISTAEAATGVVVNGTAEAGARVTGQWGAATVTTVAGDDGRFVLQFGPGTLPGQGVQELTVTAFDSFGNASDASSQLVLLPGNSIQIEGVVDDVGSITGVLGNFSVTNDTFPTLFGSLERPLAPDEMLQVWRNGVLVATGVEDGVIADGTNWTFTDGRLADGTYTNSIRILAADGSVVDISDATFTFIIDNDATGTPAIRAASASTASTDNALTIASADLLEPDNAVSLPGNSDSDPAPQAGVPGTTDGGGAGQFLDNNLAQYPDPGV